MNDRYWTRTISKKWKIHKLLQGLTLKLKPCITRLSPKRLMRIPNPSPQIRVRRQARIPHHDKNKRPFIKLSRIGNKKDVNTGVSDGDKSIKESARCTLVAEPICRADQGNSWEKNCSQPYGLILRANTWWELYAIFSNEFLMKSVTIMWYY